jgi:deoxyribonuclease-4
MHQQIWIGAHTSAAGGAPNALLEGAAIGASAIQLFTSNQKQWTGRTIEEEELALWRATREKTGIDQVMSHDSYLINLGAFDPAILEKSRHAFREEIERCHLLDIPYLNFHPGAATKGTAEECLETIVQSLLSIEDLVHKGRTRLLLETTAGQGSSVGHSFEQIAQIVRAVEHQVPIGVCIDTCHIFVAGYDIRTQEGWLKTLTHFDQTIGLKHLKAFHVNDSMKECGSRVDRHAPLGQGHIGIDSFRFLMQEPRLRSIPKFLETPGGPPVWKEEISLLKSFAEQVVL